MIAEETGECCRKRLPLVEGEQWTAERRKQTLTLRGPCGWRLDFLRLPCRVNLRSVPIQGQRGEGQTMTAVKGCGAGVEMYDVMDGWMYEQLV